jgi:hypothetical protein
MVQRAAAVFSFVIKHNCYTIFAQTTGSVTQNLVKNCVSAINSILYFVSVFWWKIVYGIAN